MIYAYLVSYYHKYVGSYVYHMGELFPVLVPIVEMQNDQLQVVIHRVICQYLSS